MKCNFNFIVYWYLKELIISKVKSGEYAVWCVPAVLVKLMCHQFPVPLTMSIVDHLSHVQLHQQNYQ